MNILKNRMLKEKAFLYCNNGLTVYCDNPQIPCIHTVQSKLIVLLKFGISPLSRLHSIFAFVLYNRLILNFIYQTFVLNTDIETQRMDRIILNGTRQIDFLIVTFRRVSQTTTDLIHLHDNHTYPKISMKNDLISK